jgi:proton-coupled amino acid transporter
MFIRQLSRFRVSILLADLLLVLGLLFLYGKNIATLADAGVAGGITQFDSTGYFTFLGTALYALEGTAFILPIEHAMQNKSHFNKITWVSGLAVGLMYMSFGLIGYLAFGDKTEGNFNGMFRLSKFLLIFN